MPITEDEKARPAMPQASSLSFIGAESKAQDPPDCSARPSSVLKADSGGLQKHPFKGSLARDYNAASGGGFGVGHNSKLPSNCSKFMTDAAKHFQYGAVPLSASQTRQTLHERRERDNFGC